MNKNNPEKSSTQSPLDHLLQEELWPHIGPAVEAGCLLLLPAQTGIGKTHTIKNTILHELLAEQSEPSQRRTLYYITNSVDNVYQTYLDVIELIETQKLNGSPRFTPTEQALLKQQIVYLPSQSNQLIALADHVVDRVLELFELVDDKQIQQALRRFRRVRDTVHKYPETTAGFQETLQDEANSVYRLVVNQIQARQRSENPIDLSESDHKFLDEFLPGNRLERQTARVCFMTTRKFLAGYQTLKSRVHPIRELKGALLFIDEFDRQNEIVLAYMADQKAVDLIELTRTLHANLQRYQLERSIRYQGIEELFNELRKELDAFASQWHLEYSFNVEGQSLADEKVRLFSDRTVTHVHSSRYMFRLRTEQQLQKNIIFSEKRTAEVDSDETHQRLSRFINEADRLFQRFVFVMRSSVYQYQNNTAKAGLDYGQSYGVTMQEAVMSILRHYNLQDLSQSVFAAFDAQLAFSGSNSKKSEKKYWAALRSYHDRGLKLTDVRKNPNAQDTVSCHYTGLSVTPTGLLARLVESGAKVVGISATATSKTVVKNFDLDYLKARLGQQMLELTRLQKKAISDYYQQRRRYQEVGVCIDAQFVAADSLLLSAALTAYAGRPIRNAAGLLSSWLSTNGDGSFAVGWVSKLLQTFDKFMASTSNRYMLALLSRTISTSQQPDFVRFLEWYLQEKARTYRCSVKLCAGMSAQAMRAGEFEQAQQHLSQTDDKVIILSTYPSMGEGKNPDYPVERAQDRAQLLWVGSGPEPEKARADIDTLFLERPTHQLLTDQDDYQVNQLLLFHQIMALQESGYISPRGARTWVKMALQGTNHMQHQGQYYKTDDYRFLLRKIIEQAVGRTARTAFKRPCIKIFADSDLRGYLADDERSKDLLSHEYHALRTVAASHAAPTVSNKTPERAHNRAEFYTGDTLNLIRELIRGFTGSDLARARGSWENLRTQLLRHPTIEALNGNYPRLYLHSPAADGYQFSGSLEIDGVFALGSDLKFFEQAQGNRWVTEVGSGLPALMKNATARQYFEKNNFATHWSAHHNMLNPAAFANIYKGALGEEGVISILLNQGLQVEPMPMDVYEVCDFIVRLGPNMPAVAVDAKNWQDDGAIDNHSVKAQRLKQVGIHSIVYINLFGSEQSQCRYLTDELVVSQNPHSPVIEIAGVVDSDTGDTLIQNLHTLVHWLGEQQ